MDDFLRHTPPNPLTPTEAPPTWSWTSSSHSSSCMMCSKGRNRASLKRKCGGSAQLVRTSVSTSWMKETAVWETWRSWWHAACRTGGGSVSSQEVATSGGEEEALRTKFLSCVFYCLLWKKCCQAVNLRTSTRWGATTLQARILCSRGRLGFRTTHSMASPRRTRWRTLRRSSVDLAPPTETGTQ